MFPLKTTADAPVPRSKASRAAQNVIAQAKRDPDLPPPPNGRLRALLDPCSAAMTKQTSH